MANTGRRLVAAAALTGGLFTARPGAADEGPLTIVVTVTNLAEIATGDLKSAEQKASEIYEAIGVRIQWANDSDEPSGPSARLLRLQLLLLPGKMSERMGAAAHLRYSVLGMAAGPSNRAYAFTNRILSLAATQGMSFEPVLGWVMAHELGHLLLPGQGHSAAGIMRANVLEHSTRPQSFTNEQATSIRSLVTACGTAERWQ